MLKLKLQYFGHLLRTDDSLEKSLMLGKIEGRRKKGHHRMSWLDGITDAMDMNLGTLREMVRDGETRHAAVHGFAKSVTWPGNWTTITPALQADSLPSEPPGKPAWSCIYARATLLVHPTLPAHSMSTSSCFTSVSLGVVCWTAITYSVGRLGLPLHHLTPKHEHQFHTHFLGKMRSLGHFVKAAFSGDISALHLGCGCARTQAYGTSATGGLWQVVPLGMAHGWCLAKAGTH